MAETKKTILDDFPSYKTNIGIEVHVQLKTESKIFCSCPNRFGDTPNTNICPICTGHPGTLPALNKKVVDFAIMLGIINIFLTMVILEYLLYEPKNR